MAEVVVVGAGLGGLATAARLAKLGHRVTVHERDDRPGGLLRTVSRDGYTWDANPCQTTIPAVLRDLFRKSGRPIERYVDLRLSMPARRHVLTSGVALDLPTGARGAQREAIGAALGGPAAEAWTRFVDGLGELWDRMRTLVLDQPLGSYPLTQRRPARELWTRPTLERLLRKAFSDPGLRELAGFAAERHAADPHVEPAFRAVECFVERTFGVWRLPGGASDLAGALLSRMRERSVDVRFGSRVTRVLTSGDRAAGVALADGTTQRADLVVSAIAPWRAFRELLDGPPSRHLVRRFPDPTVRGRQTRTTHLGVAVTPVTAALPDETVFHGDPLVLVSRGVSAPSGRRALTVTTIGQPGTDPLHLLAGRGLDLTVDVDTRIENDRGGDPLPWAGRSVAGDRLRLARPLPGLVCLGTGLALGPTVPYVAWQAANVAGSVGPAGR